MTKLSTEIEIWQKYGAYLIGVGHIARKYPDVTFSQFLGVCGNNRGGWADATLKQAWNGAR